MRLLGRDSIDIHADISERWTDLENMESIGHVCSRSLGGAFCTFVSICAC